MIYIFTIDHLVPGWAAGCVEGPLAGDFNTATVVTPGGGQRNIDKATSGISFSFFFLFFLFKTICITV